MSLQAIRAMAATVLSQVKVSRLGRAEVAFQNLPVPRLRMETASVLPDCARTTAIKLSQSESAAHAGSEALVIKQLRASDANFIAIDPSEGDPDERAGAIAAEP
jgi:hypothetical protein